MLLIYNFHFRSVYRAYVCYYPIFCIAKHSQKMQANLHHGIGCEDELFVVHGALCTCRTSNWISETMDLILCTRQEKGNRVHKAWRGGLLNFCFSVLSNLWRTWHCGDGDVEVVFFCFLRNLVVHIKGWKQHLIWVFEFHWFHRPFYVCCAIDHIHPPWRVTGHCFVNFSLLATCGRRLWG